MGKVIGGDFGGKKQPKRCTPGKRKPKTSGAKIIDLDAERNARSPEVVDQECLWLAIGTLDDLVAAGDATREELLDAMAMVEERFQAHLARRFPMA